MNNRVYIVDTGLGNISSIVNMLRKVGADVVVCSNPVELVGASKIILPGVGSFDHGMRNLEKNGWIPVLNKLVLEEKVPVLGICLGMQLMAISSEEGVLSGLSWFDARVRSFKGEIEPKYKIPHMGWNTIKEKNKILGSSLDSVEKRYYFVHSYFFDCKEEDVWMTTDYGIEFASAVKKDNIFGVQFHPEKSHKFGMQLLERFVDYHASKTSNTYTTY